MGRNTVRDGLLDYLDVYLITHLHAHAPQCVWHEEERVWQHRGHGSTQNIGVCYFVISCLTLYCRLYPCALSRQQAQWRSPVLYVLSVDTLNELFMFTCIHAGTTHVVGP